MESEVNFSYNTHSNRDIKSNETSTYKNDGFVYCWGKNKDGELSLGHLQPVKLPKITKGVKNLSIKNVSSGGQHSAVVTVEGLMLICGSSLHGKKFISFIFVILIIINDLFN